MSFIDTIFETLRARGDLPALVEIHGADRRTATASEVLGLAAHARGFLAAKGVKPGDRVALFAPNSTRWVACDLAILGHGGIVVPLYARQDPEELAVMTRDCAPVLVLAALHLARRSRRGVRAGAPLRPVAAVRGVAAIAAGASLSVQLVGHVRG